MEGVEKTAEEKPKPKVVVPTAAAFVVDVYATEKVLGKRRAEEEPVVVQASTKRVKRYVQFSHRSLVCADDVVGRCLRRSRRSLCRLSRVGVDLRLLVMWTRWRWPSTK